MTAVDLLHEIHAEGVLLALTERGTIKIAGTTDAVEKWTPKVRQHKPELIDLLKLWTALEAAIHDCCAVRRDTDENRHALLTDCWREPATDWPWLTWYFQQESAQWTH